MADIIAYACSTRPNALWSVAQFNSALPKNRTDCDIPLVSLADYESLRSRAEKAEAERDELQKAIDSIEIENGITYEGNLWRFWASKAKDLAAKADRAASHQATCEKLAKALEDSSELINRLMHVHVAPDECTSFVKPSSQWLWDNGGTLACIAEQTANNRQALSYRKEVSE